MIAMGVHRANLQGRLFGRLVAVRYMGPHTRSSWFCRCSCGKSIVARGFSLIRGVTRSCGCLGIELRGEKNTGHGYATRRAKAPEYVIYIGIIRRCSDVSTDRSKDYVGRGIKLCDRWRRGVTGLSGFECFFADMGPRPSPLHSIDRKDNDGNYEPDNCRWATKIEQGRNRRSNRRLSYRGRSITMTDATIVANVSADAIRGRLHKGWTVEAAVETPPKPTGRGANRPTPNPGVRLRENSIRAFVANRWSPEADPEIIWQEAKKPFDADRGYIKRLCIVFSERHSLVSARAAIVQAIASRSVASMRAVISTTVAERGTR